MPMHQPSQHGNADPGNPYCIYCTDLAGNLKPRSEIREGMIQYTMKLEDWQRDKAETAVDRNMSRLPAWQGAAWPGRGTETIDPKRFDTPLRAMRGGVFVFVSPVPRAYALGYKCSDASRLAADAGGDIEIDATFPRAHALG
jgi:hypothetical protein